MIRESAALMRAMILPNEDLGALHSFFFRTLPSHDFIDMKGCGNDVRFLQPLFKSYPTISNKFRLLYSCMCINHKVTIKGPKWVKVPAGIVGLSLLPESHPIGSADHLSLPSHDVGG